MNKRLLLVFLAFFLPNLSVFAGTDPFVGGPGTSAAGGGGAGTGDAGVRIFVESATVPGGVPGAGGAKLWVRDDGPNVLIFTDDSGSDTVLGAGGGGTPGGADTQVQYNNAGSFGADSGFTYNAAGTITLSAGIVIGASTPFSDSAGVLTLQNVDALDITTEGTIETAIDTLANLTSVQGQTLTLSGALTVESASIVNQDLTTDSSPTFGGGTISSTTDATLSLSADTDNNEVSNFAQVLLSTDGTQRGRIYAGQTNNNVYIEATNQDVRLETITSGNIAMEPATNGQVTIQTTGTGGFYVNGFSFAVSSAGVETSQSLDVRGGNITDTSTGAFALLNETSPSTDTLTVGGGTGSGIVTIGSPTRNTTVAGNLTVTGGTITAGTSAALVDAPAGTLTLSNVDALDATTDATIETAVEASIDTLPNLTSVQSQTVTLSGPLTVEAASVINQDVTTDGTPTFGSVTADSTTLDANQLTSTTGLTLNSTSANLALTTTTSGDVTVTTSGGGDFVVNTDDFVVDQATSSISTAGNATITGGTVTVGDGSTLVDGVGIMTVEAGGVVSITDTLRVNGGIDLENNGLIATDSGANISITTLGTDNIRFVTNTASERMSIAGATGNITITGEINDSNSDVTINDGLTVTGAISGASLSADNTTLDANQLTSTTGLTLNSTSANLALTTTTSGDITMSPTSGEVEISTELGIGTTSVGTGRFAINGTSLSVADGPHSEFYLDSESHPAMQILPYTHDNVNLVFDAYFNGAWRSSDVGSNFNISKSGDNLRLQYDSGVTAGSAVTWNNGISLASNGVTTLHGGTIFLTGIGTNNANRAICTFDAGNLVRASSTCTIPSDLRLKNILSPSAKRGLSDLLKVKIRHFAWKDGNLDAQDGLIAQEVHEVIPEIVSVGGDDLGKDGLPTNPWSIRPDRIQYLLVQSVQDLYEEFTDWMLGHDERISYLEAENAELRARLEALEMAVLQ